MLDMYVRSELKDSLTDFLLSNGYDDFFFLDSKKYASKHMLHGDEEQVSGRQNYASFRIYVSKDSAESLASSLIKTFQGIRIFAIQCESISS